MEQSERIGLALVVLLSESLFLSIIKRPQMSIDTSQFIIALVIAFVLAGTLAYLFYRQNKEVKELRGRRKAKEGEAPKAPVTGQLQLQAYERLILLTDRIAIPNLIQRLNQPGVTLRDMQALLTHTIRQEFEHNITQQIYVTAEAWDAVRNFKEQNLLIINQVASYLPAEASGADLNKQLLDLLVQNPKASLQNVVSDALSYEAKKLMTT